MSSVLALTYLPLNESWSANERVNVLTEHFSQRVTHLPGSGPVPRVGWLTVWGRGRGAKQLSGFPVVPPLASEVREVGGATNRWLLRRLAPTGPTQRPRGCGEKGGGVCWQAAPGPSWP